MALRDRITPFLVALVGVAIVQAAPTSVSAAGVPPLDHVFVIVMENHSYGQVIGSSSAPYINSLRSSGALATDYTGVAHPSLPNYLAVTGGSTFGITSDCTTCWISASSIADRIESSGRTWKAYEESMPSPCYVGDSYPYAQKHDPFIYFNNIRTNAARCQSHVVPFGQISTDLASTATTPSFAFITPNMCNDMHDCSVSTGDTWLAQTLPTIFGSAAFTKQHSLLALTWDEDDFSGANQVATIFLGAGVNRGSVAGTAYNHYSLLRTVENGLGLSSLTGNDAGASPMSDMFISQSITPGACVGAASSASPSGAQSIGSAVAVSGTATGCPNPLYEFWTLAPGAASWQLARSYSSSPTFSWSTTGLSPGTYGISVWARDSSSAGVYTNGAGGWDAYSSMQYTMNSSAAGTCTAAGLATSPLAASAGTSVTMTAHAAGCASPLYQFWTLAPSGSAWQLAQAYSTSPTLTWGTSSLASGSYGLSVWVRDSSSTGLYGNTSGRWDTYSSMHYLLSSTACTSVTAGTSYPATVATGTTITISAAAAGCPHPLYQFWVLAPGAASWHLAQAYSTSAGLAWSTTGEATGTYRVSVWARDSASGGTSSNGFGTWDAYASSLSFSLV